MIKIKRENGEISRLIHAEYLPAFYFIPKEILDNCGSEINIIPRVPRQVATNREVLNFIESDFFWQVISDTYAYFAWNYIMPNVPRNIYSGDEPSWKFSQAADIWIAELTKQNIFPTSQYFWRNLPNEYFGYISMEEMNYYFSLTAPEVIRKYNIKAILDVAKEFRSQEDFDYKNSNQKIDFYRKWYHSRNLNKQISYEEYIWGRDNSENRAKDIVDKNKNIEEKSCSQIFVDSFLKSLKPKDLEIVKYRMKGKTYEDIAKLLGYSNHSGVAKKIKKIQNLWKEFEKNRNL